MPKGIYTRKIQSIHKRFWSKVDIRGEDECWEWKAFKTDGGYGQFGIKNRLWKAHRVAWMLTNKKNPKNVFICHHCDNPPCCNPKHLFLGDNQKNMEDKARKGLSNGELNNFHKLTKDKVLEIRRLYLMAGFSQGRIANIYGISRACVEKIILRKTWRHI